jgi:DNA polymerase III subunit delta'
MARLIERIVGHSEAAKRLLGAIENNNLHHAMLFVGPSGIGKKKLALALAQALLCERSAKACGNCPNCLRVENKHHESLLLVEPEKSPIKIEQSREIVEYLNLRSLGARRIIILDEAHWLNPQAANALLKVYEEPPAGTHFFLITSSLASIVSTIRSRSQVVRLHAPTYQEMRKVSHAPEWALRASQGSFQALETLTEPSEQQLREFAGVSLMAMHDDPWYYLSTEFKDATRDRESAARVADFWSILLRDAQLVKRGEWDRVINMDQKNVVETLAAWSNEQLNEITEKVIHIPTALQQNRDSQLLFESLWVQAQSILQH